MSMPSPEQPRPSNQHPERNRREHRRPDLPSNTEPVVPSPLPPELADFLKERPYAGLLHGTDHGTAFLIKVPTADIRSVRGPVPIQVGHELFAHPAAPVLRTVLTILDQPARPLRLEAFTNLA